MAAASAAAVDRDRIPATASSLGRAAIPMASSVRSLQARSFGALDGLIGDARVVGLGEGEHAVHELLLLRNRLFEHLVERLGFTAIAVESGFTEGTAVDDFVLGGDVPLTPGLAGAVFTFWPYAMQENRELIEWMRAFNARPTTRRKIRFYGLDMMGRGDHPEGLPGLACARQPFDAALQYLETFAPEEVASFRDRLEPALARIHSSNYGALSAAQREQLTTAIADLVALFERRHVEWVRRSGALAYHRAHRNAMNARGIDADLRAGGFWGPVPSVGSVASIDIAQRDAQLASSVRWVLEREGSHGRVLVFAHDTHLTKSPYYRSENGDEPFGPDPFISPMQPVMGMHLRESLGGEFISIGTFFGTDVTRIEPGAFPTAHPQGLDGPEGLFARAAGHGVFAIDWRALQGLPEIRAGLDRPWRVQFSPGMKPANPRARLAINPLRSFDGVIFVRTVGKAHPSVPGTTYLCGGA